MPPTTGYQGRLFALMRGDGATAEAFTKVAGFRATSLSFNGSPLDITNVDSDGWQEMLPDGGIKSMQISGDGIVANDTNLDALMALTGVSGNFQVVSKGASRTFQGNFVVENFSLNGDINSPEGFSISLQSNGAVAVS